MAKKRKVVKKTAKKVGAVKKTRKTSGTRAIKRTAKRSTKRAAPKRVSPIPSGVNTVSVLLIVSDGNRAMAFYQKAFGAKEVMRMPGPGGELMHGEVQIGDSRVMVAKERPGWSKSPATLGGTPCIVSLYVEDADDFFIRAAQAGARVTQPLENQFWGDRYGQLVDPFGHVWAVATHVEDVSPREMAKRAKKMFGG